MVIRVTHLWLSVPVALALGACAPAQPGAAFNDPYESVNRRIHEFNKGLDTAVLRPAGQSAAALPEEIRVPVSNFAGNLRLPVKVLNGLLQANVETVATDTMRFLINSTIGVAGFFDPAGAIGLHEVDTDFGETLAVWGVPEGAYVELPVFGPSTERDAVGRVVDFIINPLDRVLPEAPEVTRWSIPSRIAGMVIDRGVFGDTLDSILYESADSYAQSRLIFLQNRRYELGETGGDAYLDPYADAYIDPYEDQ